MRVAARATVAHRSFAALAGTLAAAVAACTSLRLAA